MSRPRLLVVVGTRPEAIKMAPVVAEAGRRGLEVTVCATAQHRELLDQVLTLFGIRAAHDLDLMRPEQSLADLTARAMVALEGVLEHERPDWLLVQGDTTTAMVAALAGFYRRVKVGHVEAGLRTGDRQRPFPEEVNRRIVDAVADAHFVPTATARRNLEREGVAAGSLYLTGNTVVDALAAVRAMSCPPSQLAALEAMAPGERLVRVTAHRRESFGEPMRASARALARLADRHRDVRIVYPVHPNPEVRRPMQEILGGVERVRLIEPLDYLPFVHLMARSYLVISDSGGVQEEAPSLGVPVLVLREKTERPEALAAGAAHLVGVSEEAIVVAASQLLDDPAARARMAHAVNPYGDGHAAERIVRILCAEPWTPFAGAPASG